MRRGGRRCPRERNAGVLGALAAIAALSACGEGERPRMERPVLGQPIAELTLPDLGGTEHSLSDYRGGPVLLNLWATWCPPCRAEMPFLQTLADRHAPDGLRVIGVTVDTEAARSDVEAFLAEKGIEYVQLLDPAGVSMDTYGIIGLPATFLLDGEGVVRFARLGPISESDPQFEAALEGVLE